MCHLQQTVPNLRKRGNISLVLDTLILFQMAFKTQEIRFQTNEFSKFPGRVCPRPSLEGSRLGRSIVHPLVVQGLLRH